MRAATDRYRKVFSGDQSPEWTNFGKGFNMRDLSNDFKVHSVKSQITFELSILVSAVA
jgi:hypothetical protein